VTPATCCRCAKRKKVKKIENDFKTHHSVITQNNSVKFFFRRIYKTLLFFEHWQQVASATPAIAITQ